MKPKKPFASRQFITAMTRAAITLTLSVVAPSAWGATDTFNTAGTTSWTCPAGVTAVQVECWGGGGAGGAGRKDSSGSIATNGGGGGGGAYARKASVPVTPGASYTVTIPAAAVSGTNGTNVTNSGAVNGTSVTFVGDSSVTITAAGGAGGLNRYVASGNPASSGAAGGVGGTTGASVGDAGGLFAGGAGSNGIGTATNVSGSGGGGAGNSNPGGAAVTGANVTTAGAGGLFGGGAGGQGSAVAGNATPSAAGSPGATPGGGGGGAKQVGTGTTLGGLGGLGQISITYDGPLVVKDNDTDNLNLTTSWVGGVVPISTERAKWDGTVTGANTTVLGADTTWAGMQIVNPGGLVTIDAGNTLTLGAAILDIDMGAATQDLTMNCGLALGALNTWDVASGRTLTMGGVISGSNGIATKGAGTVALTAANTYTGSTIITGGTMNITGSITGLPASSKLNISPTSGTAIVNHNGGTSTLQAVTGANVAGTASIFNMTSGLLTITPGVTTGTQSVSGAGNLAGVGAYGFYNITGGTFRNTTGTPGGARFTMTGRATASATAGPESGIQTAVVFVGGTGTIDQTNGEYWLNYSLGQTTVADSGIIDRTGSSQPFALFMDHPSGVTGGGYGVLNLAGANAQVLLGSQPIRYGNSATAGLGEGQSGFVNLAAGTLSTGANASVNLPGSPATINNAYYNFAGGTVKATANVTNWIPASSGSINFNSNIYGPIDNTGASSDFTGSLTVDSNSFNMAITNPLLAPGGSGVTQANLSVTGGSGYSGPPAVIFSSTDVLAGGSPAAGYALISGGAVTGIVITSPGTYINGTVPTVTLIGGGGTGASVTSSALNTANTSGALTKIGSGTLTLAGANTYTGATNVNVGSFKLSSAGSSVSDVVVASGASAGALVAATDGQHVSTGDITYGNNSTIVIDYGAIAPSTTVAPLKVDNLNLGSNLSLLLQGSLLNTLAVSQAYPLATWTTSGPVDGSAITSVSTHRLAGTLGVSANTLLFTVTSNSIGAISWNTGNGAWDTVTSNWLAANATTTTYIDPLDDVLFGDAAGATGNPIVTLNSTVSPVSVKMNSTSHDYTVSGTGGIAGTGGLTLEAANTRTLALATANTYTGATTISGGTLQLGDGGTGGSLNTASAISLATGTTLAVNQSDTVTQGTEFSGLALTGAGGFTQAGAGTTVLNAANTYTGPTAVSAGTLQIAGTGTLGTAGAYAGTIALGSGATLRNSSSVEHNLSGQITGLGSITKDTVSTSSLVLSNVSNSFSGGITITDGRVTVATAAPLSTGTITVNGNSTVGGQLFVTGTTTIANNFVISGVGFPDNQGAGPTTGRAGAIRPSGGQTYTGSITLSGDSRIGFIQGTGTVILSGRITGGFGIDFAGGPSANNATHTFTLSNTGTATDHTGNTSISCLDYSTARTGGKAILRLGAANQIPNGSGNGNLVFNGADANHQTILEMGGFSETINGLSNVAATGAIIQNTVAGASTLTVGDGDTSSSFSGNITNSTGTLALTKIGTGTLTLSGTHTYTGSTTVSAGTLGLVGGSHTSAITVNNLAALGFTLGSGTTSTSAVTFNAGATVKITGTPAPATSYTLLTTTSTISGTPTLNPPVPGFQLQVDGGNTLKLVPAGYDAWIDGFFPGETNPLIIGVSADPDKDGIPNGVEMVIGGNPATGMDTALLPTIELVTNPVSIPAIPAGDYLLFTYRRTAISETALVAAACETDTDLVAPWTTAVNAVSGVVIQEDLNFSFTPAAPADTDRVRVYVPRGANTKLFGRLNVVVP